ncbi:hypothetical protein D3C74_95530 [compost metagenome]
MRTVNRRSLDEFILITFVRLVLLKGHVICIQSCRGSNRNATQRYLEILCFQHFAPFTTFTKNGPDFKNKVLKETIEVSVVLDLGFEVECVDMSI